MNENTIESLREALRHSPNNNPLRLLLADTLLELNRLEEAEAEYTLILKSSRRDTKATIGLAKVFYKKGNYSACNVILEEFIDSGHNDVEALTLYAKGLLKENSIARALETYKKVLSIDPNFFDEELDSHLRVKVAVRNPMQPKKNYMTAAFYKSHPSISAM